MAFVPQKVILYFSSFAKGFLDLVLKIEVQFLCCFCFRGTKHVILMFIVS